MKINNDERLHDDYTLGTMLTHYSQRSQYDNCIELWNSLAVPYCAVPADGDRPSTEQKCTALTGSPLIDRGAPLFASPSSSPSPLRNLSGKRSGGRISPGEVKHGIMLSTATLFFSELCLLSKKV